MGEHVAVVGAGLSGSLLALYLARRGHRVEVFERRGDPRTTAEDEGRSINLGLSARGIRALRRARLWDEVRAQAVPMRGRYVHPVSGPAFFQPYGRDPGEILYSVKREVLSRLLIERAEKAGASFHFEAPCTDVDPAVPSLTVAGHGEIRPDYIVGADGANSTVRRQVLPSGFRQDVLGWGYKEMDLPRTERLEALHVWPGERALMVAHPNVDGSLTCTLFMPYGELDDASAFLAERFPPETARRLAGQFASNPAGRLVTVRVARWHVEGGLVLVGDACHAVYPFYGQGMNSSFEDCVVLDESLAAFPGDRTAAFVHYQALRKPHTDVLADLSEDNFRELRDRLRSPVHLAKKQADALLARLLPGVWRPLYTMVSHTTMPYGDALRRARSQDRLLALAVISVTAAALLAWARRMRRRPQ